MRTGVSIQYYIHTVFTGIYVHFMYCICAYVAMYICCVCGYYLYIHTLSVVLLHYCICSVVYKCYEYVRILLCVYVYSLGVVQVCTVKLKTHVAGMITMFALLFRYRI